MSEAAAKELDKAMRESLIARATPTELASAELGAWCTLIARRDASVLQSFFGDALPDALVGLRRLLDKGWAPTLLVPALVNLEKAARSEFKPFSP